MSSEPAATPSRPRRTGLALLGLLLTIVGPIAFFLMLDQRWVQRTAGPAVVLMALGAGLALWAAAADRRIWIRAIAGLNSLLLVLLLAGFFGMPRLPAAADAAAAERAPEIAIDDEHGRPVVLSELWNRGPVLLVFYRGFW